MKNIQHSHSNIQSPPKTGVNEQFNIKGFPRVVVDGNFVRVDQSKPFMARMVSKQAVLDSSNAGHLNVNHTLAVLESVTCNLEAGIEMLDSQENSLAKMGGRLSDIALSLNKVTHTPADHDKLQSEQNNLENAQKSIRELSRKTYKHVALFSNGPCAPIAIAVPVLKQWEGLSIERGDLSTPGFTTIDRGKLYGNKTGSFLDPGSIRRAFSEWKKLCISNRLQWGMLKDHLSNLKRCINKINRGGFWTVPIPPNGQKFGPLNRPHRNN